ncbi:MAG: hypothetical protein WAX57_03420 [Minisyncoccia bacterium]
MLTERVLQGALVALMPALQTALFPRARQNELRRQRQVHDEVPGIGVPIDNPRQYTAWDGSFKPNNEQAEHYARSRISVGVGRRLEGAIACYSAGDQMECVRHIVLALDTVFRVLDWEEASAWCNEQNTILFGRKKMRAA